MIINFESLMFITTWLLNYSRWKGKYSIFNWLILYQNQLLFSNLIKNCSFFHDLFHKGFHFYFPEAFRRIINSFSRLLFLTYSNSLNKIFDKICIFLHTSKKICKHKKISKRVLQYASFLARHNYRRFLKNCSIISNCT